MSWPGVLYAAGLLVVLGVGAAQRFRLPQTPLWDTDFWGYLFPAVSRELGGPFQHTSGRNFLYPAFLWTVLRTFGDYRVLCACQHLVGLLTGGLAAAAWNVLCGLLTAGERTIRVARFLGLGLVAEFLWSRSPLLFEHSVRPEAVFPFFLALSVLLNFAALRAPGSRAERWCLGSNVFVTAILRALKPSFGFGLIAANLPLCWFLVRGKSSGRQKLATLVLPGVVAALLLSLPERVLERSDPVSVTFLPMTLFSIHALPIHAQIVADLRDHRTAPYDAEWLRVFNAGLERSLDAARRPEHHAWHLLGFNADYLLHDDPVFRGFFPRGAEQDLSAFCFHWYRRAWTERPGEMLGKIGRQLAAVYPLHAPTQLGQDLRFDVRRKHALSRFFTQQLPELAHRRFDEDLAPLYGQTQGACQLPSVSETLRRSPAAARNLARVEALQTTPAAVGESFWVHYLNDLFDKTRLPTLLLSGALAGVVWWRLREKSGPLLAATGLLFALNFAMFLTVAIAHTVDFDRYVETQHLLTLWSGYATALLAVQTFLARRGWTQPPSTSPRAA